jgi:hypothetical protein
MSRVALRRVNALSRGCFLVLSLAVAPFGCGTEGSNGGRQEPFQGRFMSGFESGVSLDPPQPLGDEWSQFIRGADQGYSWDTGLPSRPSAQNRFTYLVSSQQNLDDYVATRIEQTTGWNGLPTRALYMQLKKDDPGASESTRNQFGIYPDSSLTQAYMAYRLKFQPDLDAVLPRGERRSRMVMEWKETGTPRADFRWNIFVQRDPGVERLFWRTQAQFGDLQFSPVAWECISYVPAPVGEWMRFESFWRLDRTNGRVWAAVNGQTIVDYRGVTQNDSELQVWWPFKVYVGGSLRLYPNDTFYQWVDDVEIGQVIPASSQQSLDTFSCETF